MSAKCPCFRKFISALDEVTHVCHNAELIGLPLPFRERVLDMDSATLPSYSKPPVVEVIAELVFEGSEAKPEWSEATAKQFLKSAAPDFQAMEVLPFVPLEFHQEEGFRTGTVSILKMRARSKSGERVVQVGNDYLACHVLRGEEQYDFSALTEYVSQITPLYNEFFLPVRLKQIGLWYVDIISIPDKAVDMDAYFNVGLKLPEADSPVTVGAYDLRVLLHVSQDSPRVLDLRIQDIRPAPEGACKFRLDWHLVEDVSGAIDPLHWLQQARQELYLWFERALTDRCRDLFE